MNDDTESHVDSVESQLVVATAKIKDRTRQLSASREDMQEARRSLEDAIAGLRDVFREVDEFTKESVSATRGTRMAAVAEISLLANSLRDVRKFFLGAEYEDEKKRLREFVELCERLKALKDSGFLDSVADTMLKLS